MGLYKVIKEIRERKRTTETSDSSPSKELSDISERLDIQDIINNASTNLSESYDDFVKGFKSLQIINLFKGSQANLVSALNVDVSSSVARTKINEVYDEFVSYRDETTVKISDTFNSNSDKALVKECLEIQSLKVFTYALENTIGHNVGTSDSVKTKTSATDSSIFMDELKNRITTYFNKDEEDKPFDMSINTTSVCDKLKKVQDEMPKLNKFSDRFEELGYGSDFCQEKALSNLGLEINCTLINHTNLAENSCEENIIGATNEDLGLSDFPML